MMLHILQLTGPTVDQNHIQQKNSFTHLPRMHHGSGGVWALAGEFQHKGASEHF